MQVTEQVRESDQLEHYSQEKEPLAHEARQKRRPSPTTWRIALNSGDNLMVIIVCIIMAQLVVHTSNTQVTVASWTTLFFMACLALVSWNTAAHITQAHDLVNANSRLRSLVSVFLAFVLLFLSWSLLIASFALDNHVISINILFMFIGLGVPLLSAWRLVFATYMHQPRFQSQAVIVGLNDTGEVISKELRSIKGSSLNVLGYINEMPVGKQPEKSGITGLPILGGKEKLHQLAEQGMIDTIIMAVDYGINPDLFQEAFHAAQLGVTVVPVTEIYERTSGKLPVAHIGDQWYLSLPLEIDVSPFYICWQKVLDMLFGLAGLIALLAVMPVLALCIYFDDPGPIFYTQERIGYQGRKFRIYKFRSMKIDADKGKAQWTTVQDKRVTRVGAFMRATHMDELPQVFNILRGDMSLIGPRPERQEFVARLERSIPFYRFRLNVKPGLTGWAQVKYRYGNTDQDALIKLQYDLYYIKHRSFMLDVLILLMTVIEVLFLRGL